MQGIAVIDRLHLPAAAPVALTGDPSRAGRRARLVELLVMLAATLAELALAAGFASGMLAALYGVAGHVAIVGWLGWRYWRGGLSAGQPSSRVRALFLITTAALGPVGATGALLTVALLRIWTSPFVGLAAWQPPELAEEKSDASRGLYRRLQRHARSGSDPSRVAPFSDVLARGSVEQKQAVVVHIASGFQPAYAPVLLGALSDEDPAVRVLAAAAAARIETDFLRASMALEERHSRNRTDFDAKWTLASHHDQYANTGLLDETRVDTARLRALHLYRECAALRPHASEVLHAEIRLLVRLGQDEEASRILTPLLAEGKAPAETLTWYVESLFKSGRYEPLRQACELLSRQPAALAMLSQPCRDAVLLWSEGTPVGPVAGHDAAARLLA